MLNLSGADPFAVPDPPYGRKDYVRQGLALMALKYVVDVAVIWAAAGVLWTPVDYVLSLASLQGSKTAAFPSLLNAWLLLWTLPFVCIGIVLSVRRARDAGLPVWIVAAFFLPVLNYVLMLVLSAWPTSTIRIEAREDAGALITRRRSGRAIAAGAVAGALMGVACVAAGTLVFRSYGAALFLATPFLVGAVSASVAEWVNPAGRDQATLVVLAALGAIAGALLLFAIEGIGCMLMAAPLAVPLALLGGLVGHAISSRGERPATLALIVVLLPAGHTVDRLTEQEPLREVYSAIVIDAPPERVWNHVVKFSDIQTPPSWFFRLGLSYPLRARIEGEGVGAVRYCEFTTGAFREPITVWDAPVRLAFDVVSQPRPLVEWSPYSNVYAPHLDGFFKTTNGEFRLVRLDGGRTRLEGRTWYSVNMQPLMYWSIVSDAIVHRIHDRVLQHIKNETETAALAATVNCAHVGLGCSELSPPVGPAAVLGPARSRETRAGVR